MGTEEVVASGGRAVKESPRLGDTNAVCDAQLVLSPPTLSRPGQRGAHIRMNVSSHLKVV